MSDFEKGLRSAIGTAVDAAARATVTPPFGAVEHRAHVHRRRQIVAVAAAVTAVVATGALAVPRIDAREGQPANGGRLRPYEQFEGDERARDAYRACRDAHRTPGPPGNPDGWTVAKEDRDACFRQAGYEPPDDVVGVPVPPSMVHATPTHAPAAPPRCAGPHRAGEPGSDTVAGGQTRTLGWDLVLRPALDGASWPCLALLAAHDDSLTAAAPGLRENLGYNKLWWATYETSSGETLLAIYGAVDADTDHVKVTVEGRRREVAVTRSDVAPYWRYVAMVFPVKHVEPNAWKFIGYDADGYEVVRVGHL